MTLRSGPYIPRQMPAELEGLVGLALDLRWTWNHGSDALWEAIDPDVWSTTRNAWLVLNTVSDQRLEALATDPDFLALLSDQLALEITHEKAATWFGEGYSGPRFDAVAFFSMEFGIAESLPIYSGGLGVLAGDLLKAANDLGVPVVAVGLLYQQGYFHQSIDVHGDQLEFYPYNDPTMLPLSPLRDDDGEWVRVNLAFPGREVRLRAWRAQLGRCNLLLLDSNDPRNEPGDRGITSELYGGGDEKRLEQEVILGIGGWRLLDQLGLGCHVCHLNEGHTAFAALERIRCYRVRTGQSFNAARIATRAGNLFTTHTPVPAGFDHFAPELVNRYLASTADDLGVPLSDLIALGQVEGASSEAPFNMAYLAIRLSGAINAVSRIHQRVSRRILQPLFPRWPREEVPVGVVTNGVHTPTWDSPHADTLWTDACGKDRWRGELGELEAPLNEVNDHTLWHMRLGNRRRLLQYAESRLTLQRCGSGIPESPAAACGLLLRDDVLTLGFARRFTEYKRPNLLLQDPERLISLINDRDRPIQIIIAGKAHPRDERGKELLMQWQQFIRNTDLNGRVVFLEDYDLQVATYMVQGVDVWLNSPRTSWEACGTSGMKVLVNGGLNLSQSDGWWAEAYEPGVGWSIGQPNPDGNGVQQTSDEDDALELFRILEDEVVPLFYDQDKAGIPRAWLAMMRQSMAVLTPRFSANRMVREYTEQFYGPLYQSRMARDPGTSETLEAWQRDLALYWRQLRFGNVLVDTEGDHHQFTVQVHFGNVQIDWVSVELFADGEGLRGTSYPLNLGDQLTGTSNAYNFHGQVPADRPAGFYTPRIVPRHALLSVPLECPAILWHR